MKFLLEVKRKTKNVQIEYADREMEETLNLI